MNPENHPVYVQLHEAVATRKYLLESAISSIELLERFEHLKETRSLKRETIKQAATLMQEIDGKLHKFISSIPQTTLRRKEKRMISAAWERHEEGPSPTPTKNKETPELKRLKSELYEIRSRLSSLDV